MLEYDFGTGHPLKPERLRRAIELLQAIEPIDMTDPGVEARADVLRVHDPHYVDVVHALSSGDRLPDTLVRQHGFGSLDNPAFIGMYEAALAYCAGTAHAAYEVRDGSELAFGLAGGLHHAHRSKASGFCIFDDPAIAIAILRERFERVAYVDIDVHHGDGVQWLFYDDPYVLTCSIHESGRSLFPSTGWVEETGESFTSINVPLERDTTGDVWLWAFRHGILEALAAFRPQAIVLQMGADAHLLDPLGHLRVGVGEWWEAIRLVREFGVPIVAVGGGGYNLTTVPRMWVGAVLTLLGRPIPSQVPPSIPTEWGIGTFVDREPAGEGMRREEAAATLGELRPVLDRIPRP